MGILDTAKAATFTGPTRFALHTIEGFGKTTLASHFPTPLFICGENGFPRDLKSAPMFVAPKTWEELIALVDDLITGKHSYLSVVFDTMDWLEPLIWKFVCARDTNRKTEMNKSGNTLEQIEDYGYGKGYVTSADLLRGLLHKLDELQAKRGLHVVLLMHSYVKKIENLAGDDYSRWIPKMHERCARLVIEWCENVFFGYFEITTMKEDPKNKTQKAKASSTGRRILGTRHNALYDAKNRMNLPDVIELTEDPNELIPYLLGKHIKAPAPVKAAPPSAPAPVVETKATTKESAAETEKKIRETYDRTVDEKRARNAAEDAAITATATDEMKRAEAMLADVERVCGVKLRKDIEKWLAAADSPEKVDWCFAEAAKKIAAKKSEPAAASA